MLASLRNPFQRSHLLLAGIVLAALFIGAALPLYVGLMEGKLGKLAAVPAVLLFSFLLIYDRKLTFVLIMLFRASGDIFLSFTRFSLGGRDIGVGGLINALIIGIALMLVFERPKEIPGKSVWMWWGFMLVSLASVFLSPTKPDAVRTWLTMVSCFAVFASSFHLVKTREDFLFCVKLVLWSSVFPVFFGFVDIALNHASGGPDGFRVRSTFGHPNEFAFYLLVVLTLAFYRWKTMPVSKHGSNAARLVLSGYMLVVVGMLVLTKTRSAWLACALEFTVYAVLFERRYLIYMACLVLLAPFIPGVADRLGDLGKGNEVTTYAQLNSFAWRVYLWESALNSMRPVQYLIGNGLLAFKESSQEFFPLAGRVKWGAHSVFVQLIYEMGALGVASYLLVYYGALRQLVRMLKIDKLGAFFLIVIVVNYLICAISDNMLDYLTFNWYVWFPVGAGCALVRATLPAKVSSHSRPDWNTLHGTSA
jgi:hypothetical protein